MKLYDLTRLSVVIVDDNRFMRSVITSALNGLGVRTIMQADNANAALQNMRDLPVDLLVCDYEMPNMTGMELVKLVRSTKDIPNPMVPIIMLTGNTSSKTVKASRDMGATEFLAKPVTPKALYTRIVEIIENPRQFVRTQDFFGPDRRRHKDAEYKGPKRRSDDEQT